MSEGNYNQDMLSVADDYKEGETLYPLGENKQRFGDSFKVVRITNEYIELYCERTGFTANCVRNAMHRYFARCEVDNSKGGKT